MNIFIIDMAYVNRSYTELVEVGIGVMIVSGILKESGHNIEYCKNLIHHVNDIYSIIESIDNFCSEAVVFSTRCDNYILALRIAEEIKKRKNSIIVVFAGPQATHTDRATIQRFNVVDIIIRNEGEITTKELFQTLENGDDIDDVDGITYRIGENCVRNKDRMLLPQIEFFPDYSIMPEEYVEKLKTRMSAFRIEAGRGCPYGCSFCSTSRMWKHKYRIKTVEQIYFEMKFLNQQYGINNFVLEHDSLSANRKVFRSFLLKLSEINESEFTWKCSSRIDTISLEDIELMWKAGCREIYFGIESGSEKMQKVYKKGLEFKDFPQLLSKLNRQGIFYTCSFICGHPEEEEGDFEKTLELMLFCNIFFNCKEVQLHRLSPENGSDLYDAKQSELIFDESQISDQTASVLDDYERSIIKEYPDIFSCYYSFKIKDGMEKIYDSTFKNGIRWIRYFPISIYIITKLSDISMLDIVLWDNIRNIWEHIESIKSCVTEKIWKEIIHIYEFEYATMMDFIEVNTLPADRYISVNLKNIVGEDIRQSLYMSLNKDGKVSAYLNIAAELMRKYNVEKIKS